ncbi:MAG TPA: hypothetical protein VHD87_02545 [Acidimicrobiales bacterium]|nr:hypothetical protein [Acidimicrobiales bacterium]
MNPRSLRSGALAATGLALFYVTVVWWASGSFGHLVDQAAKDWYFLALIVGGFGTQVALVSELRRRHRLLHADAVAGGAGMGASTAGMVACCAHHIADLAPFIGATGAATFLTNYRIPFMVVGIGVNAIGVARAAQRLRHMSAEHMHEEAGSWAHA